MSENRRPDAELVSPRARHRREFWQRHDRETYRCPDCGRLESHAAVRGFQVHHCDEDPTNGDPENLVALCRACHQERHGHQRRPDLNEWKRQFRSLGDAA